jgi:hypothetical protein
MFSCRLQRIAVPAMLRAAADSWESCSRRTPAKPRLQRRRRQAPAECAARAAERQDKKPLESPAPAGLWGRRAGLGNPHCWIPQPHGRAAPAGLRSAALQAPELQQAEPEERASTGLRFACHGDDLCKVSAGISGKTLDAAFASLKGHRAALAPQHRVDGGKRGVSVRLGHVRGRLEKPDLWALCENGAALLGGNVRRREVQRGHGARLWRLADERENKGEEVVDEPRAALVLGA